MNQPDRSAPQELHLSRQALDRIHVVSLNHMPPQTSWPRILLVHGTMDRATSFKRVARHLSEFEVVSYDRRGYGNSRFYDSNGVPQKVTWQIHLSDLTDLISEKPTVIFGHSYGGTLTLLAAERRVKNLLGIVTFEPPLSWWKGWSTWSAHLMDPADAIDIDWARNEARRFIIAQIGEETWNKLPKSTKAFRESEGVTMVSEMRSMANLFPVLDPSQIAVPTIISRSLDAPERHVKGSRYLVENIPNSKLEIIANTTHGIHLRSPDQVGSLLRQLIANC